MAAEGHAVKLACRVLAVSESGFHAQRHRPLSARAIRHAALTDLIGRVHLDSRGTYGARRVHAELTLGHSLAVGLEAQADDEAILADHGYLTQSSELAREGSLMVAYVLADQADEYRPLERDGLGAATDPDSLFGCFARPLAWAIAISIVLFAAWLLVENLAGS